MAAEPPAQPGVLVIEDDPDIGKLLKWVMEREGYSVTLIDDGRKAREHIAVGAAARLVVLDVMLPQVSGHDLLKDLRAHPAWRTVPVIMLTAKSQERDIVRALDAGANDYLLKPFQPAELRARIRRLVTQP
jgi:two-component system, OmpR family, alkaline phosphatase synthesis response regulator PhoP